VPFSALNTDLRGYILTWDMYMHVSIISCCLIYHAIQTKSVTHRTQQYIATI
jgi:hypothetical protein